MMRHAPSYSQSSLAFVDWAVLILTAGLCWHLALNRATAAAAAAAAAAENNGNTWREWI